MSKQTEIESAIFKRLINHLKNEPEIQNIDLMNLAGFCRNCLSKWYAEEASALGESINEESARELIYGMDYGDYGYFKAEMNHTGIEQECYYGNVVEVV